MLPHQKDPAELNIIPFSNLIFISLDKNFIHLFKIITIAIVTIFNLQQFNLNKIMGLLVYFSDDKQFILGDFIMSEIRVVINGFGRVEHKVCGCNE